MLSITFCVSRKPQPVPYTGWPQLISYCMHVRIKGTAPGVEQGKELSLLVEEWSSPKSRSLRADVDGPRPVTYISLHVFHVNVSTDR